MDKKKNTSISLALITVFISVIYFQTLSYQLINIDDETLIHKKFIGLTLSEQIPFVFNSNYLGGSYYRPITLLTFIGDSLISGQSYFAYHLTNVLIHLLTSILLFLISKKMGYSDIVSFFSAVLFAVNPLNINAVAWIAGRGDQLSAFFVALALLIFLQFIKNDKIYLLPIVTILLFLSILSKEVGLLIPFLFMIFFILEKKEVKLNKSSSLVLLMTIFIFSGYFYLREYISSDVYVDKFSFYSLPNNLFTLPETLSKFIIPFFIKTQPSFDSLTTVSGIIIFLVLLLLPLKITSINRFRYYFGLLWFILLYVPGMLNKTTDQSGRYYWDCRSYLSLLGFIFVIGEVINVIELRITKKIYCPVFIIYILLLSILSFQKIRLYENPVTYWSAVKADYPNHFLSYLILFDYYKANKDYNKAEQELLTAIQKNPDDLSLITMLNSFYLTNNMKQKFLLFLKNIIDERIKKSNNLLRTYIGLAIELDSLKYITELLTDPSMGEDKIIEIKKIIKENIDFLKKQNNIPKAELLEEKLIK